MEPVPDFGIGILEKLAQFARGGAPVTVESLAEAVDLLQAARAYDVRQLEECCTNVIVAMLTTTQTTVSDAIHVHDVALQLGIAQLVASSGRRLKFAGRAVLQCDELLRCRLDTVVSVLQLGIVGVTPVDTFHVALRYWAARHCGRGMPHWRRQRDRLFGCVQYELMDRTELATFVRRSGVFSNDEYIAILERVLQHAPPPPPTRPRLDPDA